MPSVIPKRPQSEVSMPNVIPKRPQSEKVRQINAECYSKTASVRGLPLQTPPSSRVTTLKNFSTCQVFREPLFSTLTKQWPFWTLRKKGTQFLPSPEKCKKWTKSVLERRTSCSLVIYNGIFVCAASRINIRVYNVKTWKTCEANEMGGGSHSTANGLETKS